MNCVYCRSTRHTIKNCPATAVGQMNRARDNYRGERNAMARLTREQVQEIRRRYARGSVTHAQLAEEFGVTRPHISSIVRRKFWPWLDETSGGRVDENRDAFVTVSEAAKMLGVSRQAVGKLIERGRMTATYSKEDTRYKLIPRFQVDARLRQCRTKRVQ